MIGCAFLTLSNIVAIAYVMQKVPYVFPIVGGRKVEHLHANLEALDVTLAPAHIRKIEGAVPFEPGVPHNLTVSDCRLASLFLFLGNADDRSLMGVERRDGTARATGRHMA